MNHKLNKPRVFLSHSKKDEKFIGKLYMDLRRCQIEPWMDTEEIRDGKSWLKVIFEDGIPTCDVVIVYFSENSITSKMVGKEIDAALVEQFSEKGIAFLPYVENEKLRARLRSDIRSLHCRLWNDANYSEILPSVVAEIWHSYLEKSIQTAVMYERNKRLELQLEMTQLKDKNINNIFLPSEEMDFKNIYKQLNKQVIIAYDIWENKQSDKGTGKRIGKETFGFNLFELLTEYVKRGYYHLDHHHFLYHASSLLKTNGYPRAAGELVRRFGNGTMNVDYLMSMKAYGLTKRVQLLDRYGKTTHQDDFTEKVYRFLYWTEYNNLEPKELSFEYIGFELTEPNQVITTG
ncbi:MAG: toll/interleukin-1 receptor domain-containing protein [Thermodesulfobacteriota bacterium]|nr:toll/interleukin-1 receptor domain-containing protein [Thermodesulfobacteriota bacterium]